MKGLVSTMLAALAAIPWLLACSGPASAGTAEAPPKDRVVAMYFHRTQRCPTCLKMGAYAEEAIKKGFAEQVKERAVEFHAIDFQNEGNAAFTKAYKITGPALIVARVAEGKVAEYKDLKEIWSHVTDKKAFLKYVHDHVAGYLAKQAER